PSGLFQNERRKSPNCLKVLRHQFLVIHYNREFSLEKTHYIQNSKGIQDAFFKQGGVFGDSRLPVKRKFFQEKSVYSLFCRACCGLIHSFVLDANFLYLRGLETSDRYSDRL